MDIKTLIKNYESATLECKKAAGGLPNSIWETYSAFANTNGGTILLGVEEINKELFIRGVQGPQDLIKMIWDILNNPQKVSVNILSDRHIYIENTDGMDVVVIEVPRADRHDKPVYIGSDCFSGSFRRNFEGDYRCTKTEVKNMLRDQVDITQDSKILANMSLDVFDKECIRRYRTRFTNLKPNHVWNPLNQEEFLYKVGAIKRSDEDNKEHPTVAGLLMFGEESAIMEEFPEYFLDYREKYDETNRWTDRVSSNTGDWSGNIFDFYYRVINKLTADLKVPFQLVGGVERSDDTRVHQAMREALANALIHANYYGRQGIVIEKTKNETIISNPGGLRISLAEALEGGISDPRNPVIFKMFSLINVGERAGSCLSNIQHTWEEQHWEKPMLIETFEPERTTLKLKIESIHDKVVIKVIDGKKTVNDSEVMYNDRKAMFNDDKVTVNDGKGTVNEGKKTVNDGKATDNEDKKTVNYGKATDNEDKKTVNDGKAMNNEDKKTVNDGKATDNEDKKTVNDGKATVNEGKKTVNNGKVTFKRALTQAQEQIIVLINQNPKITIDDMASVIGITKRNIEKNIKLLKDNGILLRVGGKKEGHWKLYDT